MVVVFIVTSYWAVGELLIARLFAAQIAAHGYKPYFVIPPTHEKAIKEAGFPYTLLMPKLGKINRVLLRDIEHTYRPPLVILSDFINYCFCETHYGLGNDDLAIFSGRLGTFDNFHWCLEKREMDTYGFRAKNVNQIDVGRYGFRLLPCPIVSPASASPGTEAFYYSLLDQYLTYDDNVKQRMRDQLGLPAGKPVGLTTTATWQSTYKQYPHVKNFVDHTNGVFSRILEAVFAGGVILSVGKEPLPPLGQGVEIRHFTHLTPGEFEEVALASDLYISRNITSTTLAKFALSGLPTAALTSSVPATELPGGTAGYPYRMFPVGWYRFLDPVLRDSDYARLVNETEIFGGDQTVEQLRRLVTDPDARQHCREKAEQLKKRHQQLVKPHEILQQLSGPGKAR